LCLCDGTNTGSRRGRVWFDDPARRRRSGRRWHVRSVECAVFRLRERRRPPVARRDDSNPNFIFEGLGSIGWVAPTIAARCRFTAWPALWFGLAMPLTYFITCQPIAPLAYAFAGTSTGHDYLSRGVDRVEVGEKCVQVKVQVRQ
jgi:hypothetical protein